MESSRCPSERPEIDSWRAAVRAAWPAAGLAGRTGTWVVYSGVRFNLQFSFALRRFCRVMTVLVLGDLSRIFGFCFLDSPCAEKERMSGCMIISLLWFLGVGGFACLRLCLSAVCVVVEIVRCSPVSRHRASSSRPSWASP